MPDLKQLLEPLERREMPDRWDAIQGRRVQPLPDPQRSRVSAYLTAGAVALLAVGIVAWLSPIGRSGTVAQTAGDEQPPAWLVQKAYEQAYQNGDLIPDAAAWVLSDADTVAPVVGLQSGEPSAGRYLIVLHGNFTAYGAKVPTAGDIPRGHALVASYDPASHAVLDFGVGNQEVDVPGLAPFVLPDASALATTLQHGTMPLPPDWQSSTFALSWSGTSPEGTQISNRSMPLPVATDSTMAQASAEVFPRDGVSIVLSTPSYAPFGPMEPLSPPLSLDDFAAGSASGGGSTLDSAWIQGPDALLTMTIRIGPDASAIDLDAAREVVADLTFSPPVGGNGTSNS